MTQVPAPVAAFPRRLPLFGCLGTSLARRLKECVTRHGSMLQMRVDKRKGDEIIVRSQGSRPLAEEEWPSSAGPSAPPSQKHRAASKLQARRAAAESKARAEQEAAAEASREREDGIHHMMESMAWAQRQASDADERDRLRRRHDQERQPASPFPSRTHACSRTPPTVTSPPPGSKACITRPGRKTLCV